jgi:glycine/D-amino acid oxidase-like deaminating enzyme
MTVFQGAVDAVDQRAARSREVVANLVADVPGLVEGAAEGRTEAEVEDSQAQVTWQRNHGFNAHWLEPEEVREIEPIIPEDILGAYFTEDAGAVTLHRFTEAVAEAFQNRGGRITEYTPAVNVSTDGDRVAGIDTPSGPIYSGIVVLAAGAWTRPERRRVGFVFQDYALFPHLTVAENVGFGLPRRERRVRRADVLELVGLGGYEQRYPHELSGGQQQRVALARALAPLALARPSR